MELTAGQYANDFAYIHLSNLRFFFTPKGIFKACQVPRPLPGDREEGLDVRLDAVELAVNNHTVFAAIAISVLYHDMDFYTCPALIGAIYMELACGLGEMLPV